MRCSGDGLLLLLVRADRTSLRARRVFWQAENKHIAACRTLIKAQSGGSEIVDAVKQAFVEKEQLVHAEAAARAIAEKNKVAKDFDAKLQALVNRKANEENKAYKALVDAVYADVLQTVTKDDKFKKVRGASVTLPTGCFCLGWGGSLIVVLFATASVVFSSFPVRPQVRAGGHLCAGDGWRQPDGRAVRGQVDQVNPALLCWLLGMVHDCAEPLECCRGDRGDLCTRAYLLGNEHLFTVSFETCSVRSRLRCSVVPMLWNAGRGHGELRVGWLVGRSAAPTALANMAMQTWRQQGRVNSALESPASQKSGVVVLVRVLRVTIIC